MRENISVENISDKEIRFIMLADMEKDLGLVKNGLVMGYEDFPDAPKICIIGPKTKQGFEVRFISLNGGGYTKRDRNPPNHVHFIIVGETEGNKPGL